MIIKIPLTAKRLAIPEERKIMLPEDVFIQFTSSTYSLDTLVITVKNGKEKKQYKTTGDPINITPLCKIAGELNIEVSYVVNCEAVKTWQVEPLLLCEVEHSFEAIPIIEALKAEIQKNRAAIGDVAKLLKENDLI